MNLTVDAVEDVAIDVGKRMLRKAWWLDLAEVFDAWRVVPRSVLGALLALTVKIDAGMFFWFCQLPNDHRSAADAIATTSIITVMTTLLTVSFTFYTKSGRVWTGQAKIEGDLHVESR